MKHLTKLLIIFTLTVSAQQNGVNLITAPGAYNDGFNLGAQVTFNTASWNYVGVETFVFPELNNLNYFHFIGRFGIKHDLSFYDGINKDLKLFTGFRGGVIAREQGNAGYGLLGFEIGSEYTIPGTRVYLFLNYARDTGGDSKAYSNNDNITRNSVYTGIGLRF